MIKLIIAGERDFNDYEFLKKKVSSYLTQIQNGDNVQIVSEGAKGADPMGEKFARENGLDIEVFPTEWKSYTRGAGPKRNAKMAE